MSYPYPEILRVSDVRLVMNAGNKKKAKEDKEKHEKHRGWFGRSSTPPTEAKVEPKTEPTEKL